MFSLPSGKDRIDLNCDGTRRMLIGRGEEASVYKMLDGDFAGLVCRTPGSNPTQRCCQTEALEKFRNHQLAHLLFPAQSIDVVAVNLATLEMYSREVVRSKQNLRDCTRLGLAHRAQRSKEGLPDIASTTADHMEQAGIYVERSLPNASIVDGQVLFFEVNGLNPAKVQRWCDEHSQPDFNRKVRLLLEIRDFERCSDAASLLFAFEDRQELQQLLEEAGKLHLVPYYQSALGRELIVPEIKLR